MSYSFSARLPAPPLVPLLMGLVRRRHPSVQAVEDLPSGVWPASAYHHVYLPGDSSTGVELHWDPETRRFVVRFLALASAEDYQLGFSILEHLGGLFEVPIEPEREAAVPAGRLRDVYPADWGERQLSGALGALCPHLERRELVQLPAVGRWFFLGPSTTHRLGYDPETPGPFGHALVRAMQRLSLLTSPPGQDAFEPRVYQIEQVGAKPFRFCELTPGMRHLLPPVDGILLERAEPGRPPLLIAPTTLMMLCPGTIEPLDEFQLLVEALGPARWSRLRRMARGAELALELQ